MKRSWLTSQSCKSLCVSFFITLFFSLPVMAQDWKTCPADNKGKTLKKWRKKLVKEVVGGNYQEVKNVVMACYSNVQPKCFDDMLYYIDYKITPGAFPSGDPSSNPVSELSISSPADLPEAFRVPVEGGDTQVRIPPNIESLAAQNSGWEATAYKTRGTGGFDGGQNLFIATISRPEVDIVLQTSPHPDPDDSTKYNPSPAPGTGDVTTQRGTLTIITVDKTKNPRVGQLRIMRRDPNTGAYRWSNQRQMSSCVRCHSSPVRPISPMGYKEVNTETRLPPAQEAKIDRINQVLAQNEVSWGTTNVGGREVRIGPAPDDQPYGWAPRDSRTRTESFIQGCQSNPSLNYTGFGGYQANFTQGTPPNVNWQNVTRAMDCYSCHNNMNEGATTKRNTIHGRFSRSEIAFKIAVDRSMPQNVSLNQDERLALINCLNAERDELRTDWQQSGAWMTGKSCYGSQFGGVTPVPAGGAAAASEDGQNQ